MTTNTIHPFFLAARRPVAAPSGDRVNPVRGEGDPGVPNAENNGNSTEPECVRKCVNSGSMCEQHSCRMVRVVNRVESQSGRVQAKVIWKCSWKSSLSESRTSSVGNGEQGAYQIFTRKDRMGGQHAIQKGLSTSVACKRSRH